MSQGFLYDIKRMLIEKKFIKLKYGNKYNNFITRFNRI